MKDTKIQICTYTQKRDETHEVKIYHYKPIKSRFVIMNDNESQVKCHGL